MPPISGEEEDRLKSKLREFKKRVENGEDFGTLAYLYSADPGSAEQNGELGMMDKTDLVAEFANAATGLASDQMSDIVKSPFGYHLIQMIERKGDRIKREAYFTHTTSFTKRSSKSQSVFRQLEESNRNN